MFPTSKDKKEDELKSFTESYHMYKKKYVKHLLFNPEEEDLSKHILINPAHLFPVSELEHAPLEAVEIYFDTATYDEIERDVKVGC